MRLTPKWIFNYIFSFMMVCSFWYIMETMLYETVTYSAVDSFFAAIAAYHFIEDDVTS